MSDTNRSEIEAAAERWGRFFRGQIGSIERDEYYHSALLDEDRDALCQLAVERLAADRADREERARPIDAEWLESIGFASVSIELAVWHEARSGGMRMSLSHTFSGLWIRAARHLPHITTRGQLLDLLRAMKGGDA